ncbi:Uncharacterised protein [Vibrio cholerae]|nr:Uncharacterised protein [Vibrio cholerae]
MAAPLYIKRSPCPKCIPIKRRSRQKTYCGALSSG